MILPNAQRKRFYRIFYEFIAYAADYLTEREFVSPEFASSGKLDGNEVREIQRAIWDTGGHPEVIDAFVHDPTVKLNRVDRNIVASWREGIYGEFCICRRGPDTIFFYGDDYAFCVRGITDEIDAGMPVSPGVLSTVIVPFDSFITYLVFVEDEGAFDRTQEEMLARVQRLEDHHMLFRTGRQLEKVSSEAQVAYWQRDREFAAKVPAALDRLFNGRLRGLQESELVGLDWDERVRRVREDARRKADVRRLARAIEGVKNGYFSGRPPRSEAESLELYGVETLRATAEARGAKGYLTERELIDYFLKVFPLDAQKNLRDFRLLGADILRGVRSVIEAGGRLRVKSDGSLKACDIPPTIFPWIAYFRENGTYTVACTDDLVASLAGTDWDAELERADRLEKALAWLVVAVDFRGVIPFDEALSALTERYPDVPAADAADAIRRRAHNGLIFMEVEPIDDREYLVAIDLIDENGELKAAMVKDILAYHERISAYWPTEAEGKGKDLAQASQVRPGVQELLRYLDAHVAYGADVLQYADSYWDRLVMLVRLTEGGLAEVVNKLTAIDDLDKVSERIAKLSVTALFELPDRYLNGHSFMGWETRTPEAGKRDTEAFLT